MIYEYQQKEVVLVVDAGEQLHKENLRLFSPLLRPPVSSLEFEQKKRHP